MIYCFDIDGTLCTNTDGAYESAQPFPDAIEQVNALYDTGHRILLYTARGSTTGIDWRDITERQLKTWGVRFHQLFMGKPTADVYIDDRAVNARDWSANEVRQEEKAARRDANSSPESVARRASYLKVTYSPQRAPIGEYPDLLAQWLLTNVYKQAGHLLDLGVGRGDHVAAFSRLGFKVAGVDISPNAADLAGNYDVRIADLEREPLPFPSESFDCVFSKSVIEHLRHPASFLEKALQSLRPGGTAVIMTPSWAHTYWGPFYIDHTHITPFTAPSLADAMRIVGFQAVQVSHFYQLPFLWRYQMLKLFARLIATMPIPYRPYQSAPWPDGLNKLVRFSKEVMLLGIGVKPTN